MVKKYNGNDGTILLLDRLFPDHYAAIASSSFDDTVEYPISAEQLRGAGKSGAHNGAISHAVPPAHAGRSTAGEERSGVLMMKQMLSVVIFTVVVGEALVLAGPPQTIQEHGKATLRDARRTWSCTEAWAMAGHSHHCAEVTKHATAILGVLPKGDEHAQTAAPFLQEAITYCKRVDDMGDKVDPGAQLEPGHEGARGGQRGDEASFSDDRPRRVGVKVERSYPFRPEPQP